MESQITVRQATRQDIGRIIEIWKELMIYHAEKDSLFTLAANAEEAFSRFVEDNIASETACVFVAINGGEIVGYGQGKIEKYPPVLAVQDYGHIIDLAVAADHRRTGAGEQLVSAMRDWFCQNKITRIEVRCLQSNEIGSQFWRKMGFDPYLETLYMRC